MIVVMAGVVVLTTWMVALIVRTKRKQAHRMSQRFEWDNDGLVPVVPTQIIAPASTDADVLTDATTFSAIARDRPIAAQPRQVIALSHYGSTTDWDSPQLRSSSQLLARRQSYEADCSSLQQRVFARKPLSFAAAGSRTPSDFNATNPQSYRPTTSTFEAYLGPSRSIPGLDWDMDACDPTETDTTTVVDFNTDHSDWDLDLDLHPDVTQLDFESSVSPEKTSRCLDQI